MSKRNTPPGVGSAGVSGASERVNLKEKYSTTPSPEAKTTFCHCIVCGSRFTPTRVNHSLCRQCWSYHKVGRAIESIRYLMREVS